MAGVSVGDVVRACTSLASITWDCIQAANEKSDLWHALTALKGTISEMERTMKQYILYPDQLERWYDSFQALSRAIFKLGKKLKPAAPGKRVSESMKFVMWSRLGLKGEFAELEKRGDHLMLMHEKYANPLPPK